VYQFELIETASSSANKAPYQLLKDLSHYAVMLQMEIDAVVNGDEQISDLEKNLLPLRDLLETMKQDYVQRAKGELPVIELTLSTIAQASACTDAKKISTLLHGYLKQMEPHLERYKRQAAELQLTQGLESITSTWLEKYSIHLKSTYIMIVVTRGPKKGLIETQFFKNLRHRHGISDVKTLSGGVIENEMLAEHMNVDFHTILPMLVNDLARDLASQSIAEGMLGHRDRMHEDILSPHAKSILAALEKPTLIPESAKARQTGFWKPKEEEKLQSKCPFHAPASKERGC
jgi:hypothetical protein